MKIINLSLVLISVALFCSTSSFATVKKKGISVNLVSKLTGEAIPFYKFGSTYLDSSSVAKASSRRRTQTMAVAAFLRDPRPLQGTEMNEEGICEHFDGISDRLYATPSRGIRFCFFDDESRIDLKSLYTGAFQEQTSALSAFLDNAAYAGESEEEDGDVIMESCDGGYVADSE